MAARIILGFLLLAGATACSKLPESEEAKKIGNIPKQTIDRTRQDVEKGMQADADRNREAEKKAE